MKLLVPAYIYPSDNAQSPEARDWVRLLAAATAGDIDSIIVNVNSGPGPAQRDANYVRLINQLEGMDVRLFGYVASDYARSYPVERCIDDVERWHVQWGIDDIFVDEVASSEDKLGFYATLNAHVLGDVVLNPGTVSDARYLKCGNVICSAETELGSYNGRAFETFDVQHRARLAHIVMGVPVTMLAPVLAKAARYADYVYVTDQVEPKAFTQLPSYFERLVARVRDGFRLA